MPTTENEEKELNILLVNQDSPEKSQRKKRSKQSGEEKEVSDDESQLQRRLIQWTTHDKKVFVPSTYSMRRLVPGLYEIDHSNTVGLYFRKVSLGTEGLVRFKETNSDEVVKEIETFWEREHLFEKFDLAFKRGILLWGPPGSGKTCTIKMVIEDIIKRKGIVLKFTNPTFFVAGTRMLREIET